MRQRRARLTNLNMLVKETANKTDTPNIVTNHLAFKSGNDNLVKDNLKVQEDRLKERLEQRKERSFQRCIF